MRGGAKVSGGQADKRGSELDASYSRLQSDIPPFVVPTTSISTSNSELDALTI